MFSAVCCCRLLEELLVSLQWGREQTYYPSGQPHSTAELALTNHKLAKAVNSHLLGNVGTNGQKKVPSTVEFCSTPAEKMAETVKYLSFMICITSKTVLFSSVQFSCSVMSDSLRPHESQHARPPCPSPSPGVHSDSCPSSP